MALVIRMRQQGRRNRPFYRIVAADARAPRDGRYIEQIGHYDPMKEPKEVKIDLERIDYWVSHGAQASDTVARLIEKARAGAE